MAYISIRKNKSAGPQSRAAMLRIGKEAMQQQNERLAEYANVAFGVRQGRAIVARHRATIDRLQGNGQDTDAAKQRLKQLVGFLQIFEEDYSRLKGELEDAS